LQQRLSVHVLVSFLYNLFVAEINLLKNGGSL